VARSPPAWEDDRLTGNPPEKGPGAARRKKRRAPAGPLGEIGEAAPFGIVVADGDLRCTGANAAFAALVGADGAKAVGRGLAELLPGASPALFEAARGVLHDGRPRFRIPVVLEVSGEARRADFTLYRTDGSGRAGPRVVGLARDLGTLPPAGTAERSARLRPEAVAERLSRLQEVTAALSAAVTEAEVAQAILGLGLHVLGASGGSLCFPEGGILEVAHAAGSMDSAGAGGTPGPLRAPLEEAFLREEPVWIGSSAELCTRYPALVPAGATLGDASWAALPLRVRGRPIGALGIGFAGAHRFDEEERGFLEALAHQCAQAVDRARLYEAQRELRAQAEEAAETRELLVRELRRTLRERDESAALLDALFVNAPVGMALLDRDMRYVRMNAYLATLHGNPAQSLLGRTLWEVLPPIARDDLIRDFQQVVDGRVPLVERTVTAPPQVPGERQRTFVITWYPVNVAGRLIGVGTLVQEVTEQRIADESRRHVLGVVGHDLRSPLMAITASAELLQAGPLDERAARSVGRILRASGRIDGIIRALVDYTLVQGGPGIALQARPLDLAALVRSVAEECETAHAGREIRVTAPEPVHGEWDGDRVGQAFANLINNALQYSPEGTPAEVACWREAQEAVVEVTNAGAPIPAELVPHLFEPFRRGNDERSQRRKGLGLGLYIAVQIAAAHGGTIRVRSDEARGTTFTVRLPRSVSRARDRTP
jgi:PAS domain S-box-containing protein